MHQISFEDKCRNLTFVPLQTDIICLKTLDHYCLFEFNFRKYLFQNYSSIEIIRIMIIKDRTQKYCFRLRNDAVTL